MNRWKVRLQGENDSFPIREVYVTALSEDDALMKGEEMMDVEIDENLEADVYAEEVDP